MIDNLRLLNPFAPIKTPNEARTAARAGAVGLFVLAAASAQTAVTTFATKDAIVIKMREVMSAQNLPPVSDALVKSMVGPGMIYGLIGFSLFFGVVSLIMGFVQWRKLTKLIPLLFFILMVYSFLSALRVVLTHPVGAMETPVWQGVVGWTSNVVVLVMLWAGFRGGDRIGKLKAAARLAGVTPSDPPGSSVR